MLKFFAEKMWVAFALQFVINMWFCINKLSNLIGWLLEVGVASEFIQHGFG